MNAPPELYIHVKTGEVCEVICNATLQDAGEEMVVYRCTRTGERWVRPANGFDARLGARPFARLEDIVTLQKRCRHREEQVQMLMSSLGVAGRKAFVQDHPHAAGWFDDDGALL